MIKRCRPLFDSYSHITQIPLISTLSAMMIIAEIGTDMTQFQS